MPLDRQRATSHETTPAQQARRPRVLLVEDDATSRLVAARQLDRLGFAVTAVGDGGAAVEAVRRDQFDAVLMDRHLPEVDGLQATRMIRRLPGADDLPVIAMTGDTLAEHQRECLDAGMDDYVTKPVAMPGLREALGRWLPSPSNPGRRLDLQVLAGLQEDLDDQELFTQLVATFLAELPGRWSGLSDAAAHDDQDRLAAVAHLLTGSAAQLGATRLTVLCQRLQATPGGPTATTLLAAIQVECLGLPWALRRACPDRPGFQASRPASR